MLDWRSTITTKFVDREKEEKEKKTYYVQEYEEDPEDSGVEEPVQKRLRRNSPTQTRPLNNGSGADVSEIVVDTGNTSGLTITTNGESGILYLKMMILIWVLWEILMQISTRRD